MKRVTQVLRRKHNVFLFLPESFEWLILKSGLIDGKQVAEMLEHPEDFIESRDYFSWERFFARFLAEMTRGSWQHYRKDRLNDYYRQEKVENAILAQIEGIELC